MSGGTWLRGGRSSARSVPSDGAAPGGCQDEIPRGDWIIFLQKKRKLPEYIEHSRYKAQLQSHPDDGELMQFYCRQTACGMLEGKTHHSILEHVMHRLGLHSPFFIYKNLHS
jgi:hypothetical protein